MAKDSPLGTIRSDTRKMINENGDVPSSIKQPKEEEKQSNRKINKQPQTTTFADEWLVDVANNNVVDGRNKAKKQQTCLLPLIQLVNVSVTRKNYQWFSCKAFQNLDFQSINFSIERGKILAIVGDHQCGKTNLLLTIAGLRLPTTGQVKYLNLSDLKNPKLSIGFMPQYNGFIGPLSLEENLQYWAKMFCVKKPVMEQKMHRLMQLIGWENRQKPVNCMKRLHQTLVSLALATLHSPSVLILDQPDFGSDFFLKEQIWRQLKVLTYTEGVTILFSTSAVEDVRFADEAAVVRNRNLIPYSLFQPDVDESQKQKIDSFYDEKVEVEKFFQLNVEKLERFASKVYMIKFEDETTQQQNFDQKKVESLKKNSNNAFLVWNKKQIEQDLSHHSALNHSSLLTSSIEDHYQPKPNFLIRHLFLVFFFIKLLFWIKPFQTVCTIFGPSLAVMISYQLIGQNPYQIKVAVYNPDRPPIVSNHILNSIDSHTLELLKFDSMPDAMKAVRRHQAWAVIEFPSNYSNSIINQALQNCDDFEDDEPEAETIANPFGKNFNKFEKIEKLERNRDLDQLETEDIPLINSTDKKRINISILMDNNNEDIEMIEPHIFHNNHKNLANDVDVNRKKSRPINMVTIQLKADNTNLLVSGFIKAKLLQALKRAHDEAKAIHQFHSKWPQPMEIFSLFGIDENPMSVFMLPGLIILFVHIFNTMCPLNGSLEIIEGPIYRNLRLVKINRLSILWQWFFAQSVMLSIQIAIVLSITLSFGLLSQLSFCSVFLAYLLIYIDGVLALITNVTIVMCLGAKHKAAIIWLHLSYYIVLFLFGGILWPFECLPPIIRCLMLKICPQSILAETLRHVYNRAWSMEQFQINEDNIIFLSIYMSSIWIVAMLILILIISCKIKF